LPARRAPRAPRSWKWWFNYDEGNFSVLEGLLTHDTHFTCRSDTGETAYEEFIRADVRGRDEVMAWQTGHRRNSPYPLRHNATNVHVIGSFDGEAAFASYVFVTHIVDGTVANLSSGICTGAVQEEGGAPRLAALEVVLDKMDSDVFTALSRRTPRRRRSRSPGSPQGAGTRR
jgi:hypothetical protein